MINTNKLPSGRDIYRTLAAIKIANELKETQAAHLTPHSPGIRKPNSAI